MSVWGFSQASFVKVTPLYKTRVFVKSEHFVPLSSQAVCDHDRACGRGFSCDRHFGLCVPLRGEGHYCRRDAQCVRGLSCMFGKCHRSIPNGQEGKTATADALRPASLAPLYLFSTESLFYFPFIQVPDVNSTGIVGRPCAAPGTTANRCARDV